MSDKFYWCDSCVDIKEAQETVTKYDPEADWSELVCECGEPVDEVTPKLMWSMVDDAIYHRVTRPVLSKGRYEAARSMYEVLHEI